ncbi:MAG: hypothetical protein M3Q33_05530, partial [Acidobacteriota bacterium]|nr:hypothetical protein [Acidobacteriota bacterium]
MRRIFWLMIFVLFCPIFVFAQESGNRNYGTQRRKPQTNSGVLTGISTNGKEVYFVEANVLMNMKADAYVAVF